MTQSHAEQTYLIAFADLLRFAVQSLRVADAELARVVDAYYETVGAAVERAGGRVVKFIGDAALVVFPDAETERGVAALLDVKDAVDRMMEARGWECRLSVKAHVGPVVAGPFGAAGEKRWDVIGRAVNRAARLPATGVTVTEEVHRRLGADLRGRFAPGDAPGTWVGVGAVGAAIEGRDAGAPRAGDPRGGLDLEVLPERLAICRLPPEAPIPAWVAESAAFVTVSRTAQELSITAIEATVPPDQSAQRGYRAIRVRGPLPFDLVGILAGIAAPLADAGISLFAISTFDTDHVLVRAPDLERAVSRLREAGHRVSGVD